MPSFDTSIEKFRAISTSTISDALDRFNTNGVLTGINPVNIGKRIVGPAFTVKSCLTEKAGNESSLKSLIAYIDHVGKGEILIIDSGGLNISSIGGLASFYMSKNEVEGAVVDGGIRDVEEIRETGFNVFSRHITPLTGMKRVSVISWNVPVYCGGVLIQPGDIIVGDETGVVRIPIDKVEQVLNFCLEKEAKEDHIKKEIIKGNRLSELYK